MINGKVKAKKIKDAIVKDILDRKGKRPNLAIVLIGEDEYSVNFIKKLEQEAISLGIDTHCYKCLESDGEAGIISTIDFLNNDDSIDAILLKLPIPKNFDSQKINDLVNSKKKICQRGSDEGEDMDMTLIFQDALELSK